MPTSPLMGCCAPNVKFVEPTDLQKEHASELARDTLKRARDLWRELELPEVAFKNVLSLYEEQLRFVVSDDLHERAKAEAKWHSEIRKQLRHAGVRAPITSRQFAGTDLATVGDYAGVDDLQADPLPFLSRRMRRRIPTRNVPDFEPDGLDMLEPDELIELANRHGIVKADAVAP